jgi:glucose/arabinose dehydrogenase
MSRQNLMSALFIVLLCLAIGSVAQAQSDQPFTVEVVSDNLEHPWGMAFMPSGDILITERPGRLRLFRDASLDPDPISGLPPIEASGQGGLMGVALHPRFADNQFIYLSYVGYGKRGFSTQVLRARLDGLKLLESTIIFRAEPNIRSTRHFGGRLLFDDKGYLFISLGERGQRADAQDLKLHSGSLIRVADDGSIPDDNPYADSAHANGVFTSGNRNMQGLCLHPQTRAIWTHEHGPQGGDEVNVMLAGANYGWPTITYGRNYGFGTKIGEGTHKPGMEQPIHKWVPSIAPSGMTFYNGTKFPQWRGDLFVGSLKFGLLVRLEVKDNEVVSEQRFLNGKYGRIRDVVEGPDGLLYLLTDERGGALLRLQPR